MIIITSKAFPIATILVIVFFTNDNVCNSFHVPSYRKRINSIHPVTFQRVPSLFVSQVKDTPQATEGFNDNDEDDGDEDEDDSAMSDEELLQQTQKAQLEDLCNQFGLSTKGTKEELLERLRQYAKDQSELERQRQLERRKRVEEGGSHEKERYETVGSDDDIIDEDDDGIFYYHTSEVTTSVAKANNVPMSENSSKKMEQKQSKPRQTVLTAPPPPPIEPNEKGERVVTVYSTADQNDLTGVAAAQPGQAVMNDPLASGAPTPGGDAWDLEKLQKGRQASDEVEAAKEGLTDLIQSLLAMTGAPAFLQNSDDLSFLGLVQKKSSYSPVDVFTTFDPSKVPAEMITKASKALRVERGQVLDDVLHEFELRAIGYDGTAGDDMEKGGGHYREVIKVRAFLEGYRKAEVRRVARETTTMLLEKMLLEGIEGLDMTLATMTRNSDDPSNIELSDSLLDYLGDAIRQQEKKVQQLGDALERSESTPVGSESDDAIDQLWTVESEDGQQVETLDPNDPKVKKALEEEQDKISREPAVLGPQIPASAPRKLLLLLTLLRERLKTEAAFSHDEKSRNLRILAYCLHLPTEEEREELIMKELGASFDRLDSFAELVASSIEYGESTSHQLQPAKTRPLNIFALKNILELTAKVRKQQAWNASGAKTTGSSLHP